MKIPFCISILVWSVGGIQAQLCTGTSGDPTVHITFGSGTNPGPAFPAGVTGYAYSAKECPDDGEYTLVNSSFNCFSQTWHDIPADHTPNESRGYFMLLNASSAPGDLYVNTVSGLCPNTGYEFAVWVMNVLNPNSCNGRGIDPSLSFKIETTTGTILAIYNASDIALTQTAGWRQVGLTFTTPPGISSVVCRIINNKAGGCGNDLALDDITLTPCGPKIVSTFTANNSDHITACVDSNTSFVLSSSISPGFQNPSVQWQVSTNNGVIWKDIPGANTPTYKTPPSVTPASFKYRMIIGEAANFNTPGCRIAANAVTVNITGLPFVQATNYVFGCFGADVALFASGGTIYHWTGPNGFTSNKQHPVLSKVKFSDAGLYKVIVSSAGGCPNSDSTNLDIYPAAKAAISKDAIICEGKSTPLSASGGIRYRWSPSTGLSNDSIANPIASPATDTRYTVTVFSDHGCTDTASVMVAVIKIPRANAGPDKKTRPGMQVLLDGSVKGNHASYVWIPSANMTNAQSLQPSISPPVTTKYTLQVVSDLGCGSSSDDVLVTVYNKFLIPNAFSPNSDGINDTWIIEPLNVFGESVTHVYNRYGQIVFRSNGYSKPWDGTLNGKPVPAGNYYYVIDPKTNNEPKLTGWVFVVR